MSWGERGISIPLSQIAQGGGNGRLLWTRQTGGVSKARLDDRRCPYCGCNFTPEQPDQRYCGPWCEEQARLEGKPGDSAPPR